MADLAIRPLNPADRDPAVAVINTAARWYREFLPPAELHEPEMTPEQWEAERRRLTWYGAFRRGVLVGVMGLEYAGDAVLLRHAYVLPEDQRQGVGSRLRERLEAEVRGVGRIIVGTYAGNYKARAALEKAGYRPSPDPQAVLRVYYAIPRRPGDVLGDVREARRPPAGDPAAGRGPPGGGPPTPSMTARVTPAPGVHHPAPPC